MGFEYAVDESRLFDGEGQRKYLLAAEAQLFLKTAAQCERATRLFAELLFYTGCRITEGLELTPRRLDTAGKRVVFRTLKRRKLAYRAVPIPACLLRNLLAYAHECAPDDRLFAWSRQTGWRKICAIMEAAGIEGPQATQKGLRHQFGIHAIGMKVPEGTLQLWMGHARVRNTHIYTFAVGSEERALAARMWRGLQ
ncbi:tyrosine-type recombinase/integrase [Sphingobium sp. AN641]|uniref:tyrosine-type recombinase/integrase n=1 Tax=Sphingobium sp. AN641 TaxID=3133443 RepID=UPI0030C18BA0